MISSRGNEPLTRCAIWCASRVERSLRAGRRPMGLSAAGLRRLAITFALFGTSMASSRARAEEPPRWWQLITVNAFASTSYTWNFNNPSDNLNGLRAFDYDHNSFHIDAAEVVVQKAVANRGDFGFRIDMAMGAVAKVAAARGLFRDPVTGVAGDFDLQQAFASYII